MRGLVLGSHFGAFSGYRIGAGGVSPLRLCTFWLPLRSGLRLCSGLRLPRLPSSLLRLLSSIPRPPGMVSLRKGILRSPATDQGRREAANHHHRSRMSNTSKTITITIAMRSMVFMTRLYQRTIITVANIAVRSAFVIPIARIIPVLPTLIRACNRDWIRSANKKTTTTSTSIVQSMLMAAPRLRCSFPPRLNLGLFQ